MKDWEIIGWVKDGMEFCAAHKPDYGDDEEAPIFAGEERDGDIFCDTCGLENTGGNK